MECRAPVSKEDESSSTDSSLGDPSSPPSTDSSFNFEDSSPSQSSARCDTAESHSVHSKRSRFNTSVEKRKMRNARKKRKRVQHLRGRMKDLQNSLEHSRTSVKRQEERVKYYRQISRTYWERWRWELQKRRETMIEIKSRKNTTQTTSDSAPSLQIHNIDPTMLTDNKVDGKPQEVYLGRGSFGIVKLQNYRGIKVAVKELLPRSLTADLMHEAQILSLLCHPNLPCLFGVCTNSPPLRIVTQFHGINLKASNLRQEIDNPTVQKESAAWVLLFAQIFEAMRYLHDEIKVLHNDITPCNVLMSESAGASHRADLQLTIDHQLVIVDFGKATLISKAKSYRLSESEKAEYIRKYPYLAPEVIAGETSQAPHSDVFSVGGILHNLLDSGFFPANCEPELRRVAEQCRSVHYRRRPKASYVLSMFQRLL